MRRKVEGNDEDDVGVWPRGGEHNVLLWSLETALETNIIIVILDTGRGRLLQCGLRDEGRRMHFPR